METYSCVGSLFVNWGFSYLFSRYVGIVWGSCGGCLVGVFVVGFGRCFFYFVYCFFEDSSVFGLGIVLSFK